MEIFQMLGKLEITLMEILWTHGNGTVHDVVGRMDRPLAYTTIMTTLDRLYKKGLLDREKEDRAFRYSPRFSRAEWERKRAGAWLSEILTSAPDSRELLISCMLDVVSEHDPTVLEELERKIALKRKQTEAGESA